MPDSDSAAARAATLRPVVCSSTAGGMHAAWAHLTGALEVERVFALASEAARGEPELPGQLSLRFAPETLIP